MSSQKAESHWRRIGHQLGITNERPTFAASFSALVLSVIIAAWAWTVLNKHQPPPVLNLPSKWEVNRSSADIFPLLVLLVSIFTAVITAIGTVSSVIMAWRGDKRSAKELELKIAQLQLQLEEAKRREANEAAKTLPAPETTRKKRSRKARESPSALLVKTKAKRSDRAPASVARPVHESVHGFLLGFSRGTFLPRTAAGRSMRQMSHGKHWSFLVAHSNHVRCDVVPLESTTDTTGFIL